MQRLKKISFLCLTISMITALEIWSAEEHPVPTPEDIIGSVEAKQEAIKKLDHHFKYAADFWASRLIEDMVESNGLDRNFWDTYQLTLELLTRELASKLLSPLTEAYFENCSVEQLMELFELTQHPKFDFAFAIYLTTEFTPISTYFRRAVAKYDIVAPADEVEEAKRLWETNYWFFGEIVDGINLWLSVRIKSTGGTFTDAEWREIWSDMTSKIPNPLDHEESNADAEDSLSSSYSEGELEMNFTDAQRENIRNHSIVDLHNIYRARFGDSYPLIGELLITKYNHLNFAPVARSFMSRDWGEVKDLFEWVNSAIDAIAISPHKK
jgi:hypothetical protein